MLNRNYILCEKSFSYLKNKKAQEERSRMCARMKRDIAVQKMKTGAQIQQQRPKMIAQ